jgi:hypothetical protein
MNRPPDKRRPSSTQSAAQQAVLDLLRSGGTIKGAQPTTHWHMLLNSLIHVDYLRVNHQRLLYLI